MNSSSKQPFFGHCPICRRHFRRSECQLVHKRKNISTLYAQCVQCGRSQILQVVRTQGGTLTAMGMLTDLTFVDLKTLAKRPAIDTRELRETQQWVRNSMVGNTSRRTKTLNPKP